MPTRFAGQAAVVTGGASGIGLALCAALAAEGARVLIADVETEKAEARAADLRGRGFDALGHAVDVANRASVETLADTAFSRFGAVDLLFNNAGVGVGGPLEKIRQGTFDWIVGVNFTGIYHGVAAFAPRMLASGVPCRIVNTASEHALGLPSRGGMATAYTATKHAVLGLSDGMRRDYAGTNLAVSVLCPGLVQSEIWNSYRNRPATAGGPRELDEKFAAENRRGLPADIAATRILDQLADGEFYLFTHGADLREVAEPRAAEVAAALAAFAERYGADA